MKRGGGGGGGGGGGVLEMMGMMGVGLEEMGLESEFDFEVLESFVGEMFEDSSASSSSSLPPSVPSCSSSLNPTSAQKSKNVSMRDLLKRVERMEVCLFFCW